MPAGGNWKDMMKGIQVNDLELVRFHINMGVDVNYQHPEYMTTPLIECVEYGHVAIAKLLLENGADPKLVSVMGANTALSMAQREGNKEMEALIQEYL